MARELRPDEAIEFTLAREIDLWRDLKATVDSTQEFNPKPQTPEEFLEQRRKGIKDGLEDEKRRGGGQ